MAEMNRMQLSSSARLYSVLPTISRQSAGAELLKARHKYKWLNWKKFLPHQGLKWKALQCFYFKSINYWIINLFATAPTCSEGLEINIKERLLSAPHSLLPTFPCWQMSFSSRDQWDPQPSQIKLLLHPTSALTYSTGVTRGKMNGFRAPHSSDASDSSALAGFTQKPLLLYTIYCYFKTCWCCSEIAFYLLHPNHCYGFWQVLNTIVLTAINSFGINVSIAGTSAGSLLQFTTHYCTIIF